MLSSSLWECTQKDGLNFTVDLALLCLFIILSIFRAIIFFILTYNSPNYRIFSSNLSRSIFSLCSFNSRLISIRFSNILSISSTFLLFEFSLVFLSILSYFFSFFRSLESYMILKILTYFLALSAISLSLPRSSISFLSSPSVLGTLDLIF